MNRKFTYLTGLLMVSLSLIPYFSIAQSLVLKGQIRDEGTKEPLIGAVVNIVGTSNGAQTDADGKFEVSLEGVELPAVLSVSYLGYTTKNIDVYDATDEISITVRSSSDLDRVIVTGSGKQYTKFESSVTNTVLDNKEIAERVPRSTGDLMKTVPGFNVVSTQGEIGNGVVVRGLPPGGPNTNSFIFVGMQEDGLPVYEIPQGPVGLDYYFRADENVEKMEVVRGGSAAVFGSNSAAGLINFISKTGGDKFEGLVKTTVGSQPSYRLDVNAGGPLAKNIKFNVGGFYRHDQGIKNLGDPVNTGGQLRANLTYEFNRGHFRIYTRWLDDRNKQYPNTPYQNLNSPEAIPGGPDLGTGTIYGRELSSILGQQNPYEGGKAYYDAKDGTHTKYKNVQFEIKKEFGDGFEIKNMSKIIYADINQNNINLSNVPTEFTTGADQVYTYVNSGDTIQDIASVQGNGLSFRPRLTSSQHKYKNFINFLLLQKTFKDKVTVQVGPYISIVNQQDQSFQSILLTDSQGNPINWNTINTGTGVVTAQNTQNGFLQYSVPGNQNFISNAKQTYSTIALVVGADWKITEKLRAEGGIRYEFINALGSVERPISRNTDGSNITRFDNTSATGSGRYRTWDYNYENFNYSLGANYIFNRRLAAYVRGTHASRTPTPHNHFNLVEDGTHEGKGKTLKAQPDQIYHVEGGVKVNFTKLSIIPTVFYTTSKIRQNVNTTLQPGNYNDNVVFFPETKTYGVELEAQYRVFQNLTLKFAGTYQNARYGELKIPTRSLVPAALPPVGVPTTVYEVDVTGNKVQMSPDVIADFGAVYRFKQGVSIFANYRYNSGYFLNRRNTVKTDAWGELNGGISYDYKNLSVSLTGNNLLNVVQLQNGTGSAFENIASVNEKGEAVYDPNADGTQPKNSPYGLGQFTLPRTLYASLTVRF